MAKHKLTFDETLQRINEQLPIDPAAVQSRALARFVWVYEWHLPGCLCESWGVVTTKRDAIDSALSMAEGAEGPPRGMRADLSRHGRSDRTAPDAWARGAITTIERRRLADLF
jgi:hypothetical protein